MKSFFLAFLIVVTIVGCAPQENQDIQLDQSTFENFDVKIFKDFTIPISNVKSKSEISGILIEKLEEVTKALNSDKELLGIKYHITLNQNTLKFYNISIIEESEVNAKIYDCPEGQTLVARCYSEKCVKEELTKLTENFSAGETITIYHGGFGGVRICSDVQ